ncbi:MAG: hypothetical protein ED559_03555 [Phycisphaera sp.]|nr:MAG: hypothetical protein ED559_03555 [Phycisphaera sp.]
MGRGDSIVPAFVLMDRNELPADPDRPSLKKRVLLTLFLTLPFVVLILLMYMIAFEVSEQGETVGESAESHESAPE